MRIWTLALVVGACALPCMHAAAHKPIAVNSAPTGPDAPIRLDGTDISQVVYHDTAAGAGEVWLQLSGPENDFFQVEIGVPVLPRMIDFRPAFALVGPGLPTDAEVPFDLPPGMGAIVYDKLEEELPTPFYEPFTATEDWIYEPVTVRLLEPGVHYLVGYFPRQEPGKLLLVVGTQEQFTLGEIFSLPSIGKEIRTFHELGEIGGAIFYIPFTIILSLLILIFSLMFA